MARTLNKNMNIILALYLFFGTHFFTGLLVKRIIHCKIMVDYIFS